MLLRASPRVVVCSSLGAGALVVVLPCVLLIVTGSPLWAVLVCCVWVVPTAAWLACGYLWLFRRHLQCATHQRNKIQHKLSAQDKAVMYICHAVAGHMHSIGSALAVLSQSVYGDTAPPEAQESMGDLRSAHTAIDTVMRDIQDLRSISTTALSVW